MTGEIDEAMVSATARYTGSSFAPKTHFEPSTDGGIVLWHFNETTGNANNAVDYGSYQGTVAGSPTRATRTEWQRDYTYDKVGNRTALVRNNGLEDVSVSYAYNTLNQVTREYWTEGGTSKESLYDYDLNGNTISKEEKSSGVRSCSWEYNWDYENRLVEVVKKDTDGSTVLYSVEYQYCPGCSGARTARIKRDAAGDIESWYRYEEQGLNTLRVDEKYDSDNDGVIEDTDLWRVQRVSLNGFGNVGQILKETVYRYPSGTSGAPNSSNEYYYAYDHVGNVVNLYDDAGELVEGSLFEQDAFGNEINQSWNVGEVKRHQTGKEYDTDIKLFYFHARWYDPSTGRFTADDPHYSGFSYEFVQNAPVDLVDPDGRKDEAVCGLGVNCGPWNDDISYHDRFLSRSKKVLEPWKLTAIYIEAIDAGPPTFSLTCVAQRKVEIRIYRQKYSITISRRTCCHNDGSGCYFESTDPLENIIRNYLAKKDRKTEESTLTIMQLPWSWPGEWEYQCETWVDRLNKGRH